MQRERSAREASDEALSARVRAIHQRSRTYGAPRIRAELAAEGTPVSRKRVARFRLLRKLARFRLLRKLALKFRLLRKLALKFRLLRKLALKFRLLRKLAR